MSLSKTIRFPRGDSRILPFEVREGTSAFDLTGAEIEWALLRDGREVLNLKSEFVDIQNRDDVSGEFEIKLEKGATEKLDPYGYDERLRITDANGDRNTFTGNLRVQPTQT